MCWIPAYCMQGFGIRILAGEANHDPPNKSFDVAQDKLGG